MPNINVLILIHGVVEEAVPSNHVHQYDALWQALQAKNPALTGRMDAVIRVEWGHAPFPISAALRPDERLTEAENTVLDAVSYDKIKAHPTADDSFLNFPPDFLQRSVVRPLTRPIKETVLTLGISDSFYYCTADGERAVRDNVYSQVLAGLAPYKAADKVAIHLIGHSQGATVGFDFLYGLFAPDSAYPPDGVPGFVKDNQSSPDSVQAYLDWRTRAQQGKLVLGSKSSFGCQIGLMMLRKQKLVDKLYNKERLDPTVIGVPRTGSAKWKIFFDTDDILGFPARRLFDTVGSIREFEVDSDWNPITSHTAYWTTDQVQTEITTLITQNLI